MKGFESCATINAKTMAHISQKAWKIAVVFLLCGCISNSSHFPSEWPRLCAVLCFVVRMFFHLTNVSKSLFQLSPPSFVFTSQMIFLFVFVISHCAPSIHPFHSIGCLLCAPSLRVCLSSFLKTASNSFAKWIAMHRMCGIFNSKNVLYMELYVHDLCAVLLIHVCV